MSGWQSMMPGPSQGKCQSRVDAQYQWSLHPTIHKTKWREKERKRERERERETDRQIAREERILSCWDYTYHKLIAMAVTGHGFYSNDGRHKSVILTSLILIGYSDIGHNVLRLIVLSVVRHASFHCDNRVIVIYGHYVHQDGHREILRSMAEHGESTE